MKLEIFRPPERKFWLCRADGGRFFGHFLKHGLIAMSHVDSIPSLNLERDGEKIRERLDDYFSGSKLKQKTATNHLNQTLHFILDAKVGDLVLSVDHGNLAIGCITSDPYFEKKRLYIESTRSKKEVEMESFLRRKVTWAGFLKRHQLPFSLSKGITGQQTFFSLDEYEEEIYSMLSPYVLRKNELTANILIRNEKNISTYHYSLLAKAFLKAEFVSKNINELSKLDSTEEIQILFEKFCRDGITSSLKAEFASPGWTTNKVLLPAAGVGVTFMLACSVALNGGEFETSQFRAKLNGFSDQKTTSQLMGRLGNLLIDKLEDWLKEDAVDIQNRIEIRDPGQDINLAVLEKAKPVPKLSQNKPEE